MSVATPTVIAQTTIVDPYSKPFDPFAQGFGFAIGFLQSEDGQVISQRIPSKEESKYLPLTKDIGSVIVEEV